MGEGYLAGYCNSPSIKNWRSGLGWEQGWAGGSQVLLTVRMWSRVRDSGVLFWDEENVRGTGWVPGGGGAQQRCRKTMGLWSEFRPEVPRDRVCGSGVCP